jgi:hypothetical protein
MNYLLHASLSCCLAISTTAVLAAGNMKNPLSTSEESSAIFQDLPSIHLAVAGPWAKANQQGLIEGFWPFMQQQEQLLFLQGGWQRQQQHNLLSAGLGWRYFPETDWGVGSNLFYDQDLTRQHRRIGLGAEA